MSKKIGFWPVFALVIGSQIGSGVFMLPATLAPYGKFGLMGWLVSGAGAVLLALMFSGLCAHIPKTGGPAAYVTAAFGRDAGFFVGWTYWLISWVSTTAVVVASVGYLTPIIGASHPAGVYLILEIGLLGVITLLNCRGVTAAGGVEFLLSLLKLVPLCVIPALALLSFDFNNVQLQAHLQELPASELLTQATLLNLWGFIGVESATTPAENVKTPQRTIPRAIISGTLCVALVYLLNIVAIMGAVPGAMLANSTAPYVDAAKQIFSGNWYVMISVIASIVCIGTLNAWVLSSGQIALGLAQEGLVPRAFGKTNAHGAPIVAIVISFLGSVPLLMLMANQTLSSQINLIINFSVIAFLLVYLICGLAWLKLLFSNRSLPNKTKIWQYMIGMLAVGFCAWVISKTELKTIAVALLFTVTGVPFYLYHKRKTLL